jgi:hypothetical protein
MRFFRLSLYFRYFSALSKRPRLLHILGLFPNILFRGIEFISFFRRFVFANRVPNRIIHLRGDVPEIELLVCSTAKDFWLLADCITHAIKNSLNQICKVSVIVPPYDTDRCSAAMNELFRNTEIDWDVIDENSLIPDLARSILLDRMGESYGWALQQFLTVSFVCNSSSKGVLAVNSDTVILQPRLWLETDGRQELLVSSEFHKPYYKVLRELDQALSHVEFSLICHQMLFQPDLFRQILSDLNVNSISQFINLVLENADLAQKSPFCVEFELYGQEILRKHPAKVILNRFANIPVKLDPDLHVRHNQLRDFTVSGEYNSVSNHSWMR